jgi:hypothetical protein
MVCDPPPPIPVFAIIHLQTVEEVQAFDFERFDMYREPGYELVALYHLSSTEILNLPRYKSFAESFPPSVY